jgi:hypothetical protein
VQWKDIGSSVVKQAVQHGLLDLLSKGVGGTPAAAAAPAKPESQPAQKQEPSTTVKSIGKALKGHLGQ